MIPAVLWSRAVSFPAIDPGTESFTFQSSLPDGTFTFTFKWLIDHWAGWVGLPSGRTRQMGCVPEVINWTGYPDYGAVLSSALPALGTADLLGSTLYVMRWAP